MNYTEMLENEFRKSTGNLNANTFSKEYTEWLKERKKILQRYYMYLTYLGFDPYSFPVEIEKGKHDSISMFTPSDSQIIVVSENVGGIDSKSIIGCKGKLSIEGKEIVVKDEHGYQQHSLTNSTTFLTTLPVNTDTITLFKFLGFLEKEVYVGVYGDIKDLNKNQKINTLKFLKESFDRANIFSRFEEITDNNFYYSAIKTKKR